jgi:hypothetical protein
LYEDYYRKNYYYLDAGRVKTCLTSNALRCTGAPTTASNILECQSSYYLTSNGCESTTYT